MPWDEHLLSEVACELGLQLVPEHWRCGMTSALALESLGLLNIAEVLCGHRTGSAVHFVLVCLSTCELAGLSSRILQCEMDSTL